MDRFLQLLELVGQILNLSFDCSMLHRANKGFPVTEGKPQDICWWCEEGGRAYSTAPEPHLAEQSLWSHSLGSDLKQP